MSCRIRLCLLSSLVLAIALFTAPREANASIQNLVVNGEFEEPVIPGGSNFAVVAAASVPGWSSNTGTMEFWRQAFLSSPANGSDGNPTGQHLELNSDNTPGTAVQVIVPSGLASNMATLNFDAWLRGSNTTGTYDVFDTTANASLIGGPLPTLLSGSAWVPNTQTFALTPGNTLELRFTSTNTAGANSVVSVHIDEVELLVDVVPEPGTLFVWSILGMVGTSIRVRGKR